MTFTADVRKYAESTKSNMGEAKQAIVFNVFGGAIKKTPVDSGRAKNAWNVSKDNPDFTTSDIKSKSALGSLTSRAIQGLSTITEDFGLDILTNPLPYARKLEFGGYNHATDKTTASGFSSQAPAGMVRITVSEFSVIAKKEGWV